MNSQNALFGAGSDPEVETSPSRLGAALAQRGLLSGVRILAIQKFTASFHRVGSRSFSRLCFPITLSLLARQSCRRVDRGAIRLSMKRWSGMVDKGDAVMMDIGIP